MLDMSNILHIFDPYKQLKLDKMYTLTKTETNVKAAKFLYQVKNESGEILTERKSNRDYVACTINGQYFFGRKDLVGKGEHGQALKHGYNIPVVYLSN